MTTDCPHRDDSFDRTICPEPCGQMHYYCAACGQRTDNCPHDDGEPVWPAFGEGPDARHYKLVPVDAGNAREAAARLLAETYTSPDGEKNPHWDIDGPDDDTNPYYLPVPMAQRVHQATFITFTAGDGHQSFRPATITEIVDVLASAGLLTSPGGA